MRFSELRIPDGMEFLMVIRPGYDNIHCVLQVQPEKGDVALSADTRIDLTKFEYSSTQENMIQGVINQLWNQIKEEIRLLRYDPSIKPM